MSATRTSATISQIEEDMIEQEALIEQERSYEGPILRNENYTAQNPTDTTTVYVRPKTVPKYVSDILSLQREPFSRLRKRIWTQTVG